MNYQDMVSWLNAFPQRKQIIVNVLSVIPLGNEKVVLVNSIDQNESIMGSMIVTDEHHIVKVEYVLKNIDKEKGCKVDIRKKSDIIKKSIQLSESKRDITQQEKYSSLTCILWFSDGEVLELNKGDYRHGIDEFHQIVLCL